MTRQARKKPGKQLKTRPASRPRSIGTQPDSMSAVSEAVRLRMIRDAAYFRAQNLRLGPGHDKENWYAAESEIDAMLGDERGAQGLLEKLRRERDELRLKMHLAKLEVRQEWEELEEKWARVNDRSDAVVKEARTAGKDLAAAAHKLLDEIRRGYARIRPLL